ncbi:MAG: hypothetical protein ACJAXQ_001471, partial [Parvibaculaceae bacterium]
KSLSFHGTALFEAFAGLARALKPDWGLLEHVVDRIKRPRKSMAHSIRIYFAITQA